MSALSIETSVSIAGCTSSREVAGRLGHVVLRMLHCLAPHYILTQTGVWKELYNNVEAEAVSSQNKERMSARARVRVRVSRQESGKERIELKKRFVALLATATEKRESETNRC